MGAAYTSRCLYVLITLQDSQPGRP